MKVNCLICDKEMVGNNITRQFQSCIAYHCKCSTYSPGPYSRFSKIINYHGQIVDLQMDKGTRSIRIYKEYTTNKLIANISSYEEFDETTAPFGSVNFSKRIKFTQDIETATFESLNRLIEMVLLMA